MALFRTSSSARSALRINVHFSFTEIGVKLEDTCDTLARVVLRVSFIASNYRDSSNARKISHELILNLRWTSTKSSKPEMSMKEKNI